MKLKPYLIILYFLAFVVTSALSDATYDEGQKIAAHILEVVSYVLLFYSFRVLSPRNWIAFSVTLIAWNVVGFDWLYNVYCGLPWNFLGSTSLYDRFFSKYPYEGLVFVKSIFLFLAIYLPVKYESTYADSKVRRFTIILFFSCLSLTPIYFLGRIIFIN